MSTIYNTVYEKSIAQVLNALDALTASGLSSEYNVAGADSISLWIKRSAHSSGSSTFTVEGTLDGTNWVVLNFLLSHVVNDNTETLTRVAAVALASDTNVLVGVDIEKLPLLKVRVRVVEVTDGTHNALLMVKF